MSEVIHCIGDSHVSFFSGKNAIQPIWPAPAENLLSQFKSYRLGAVLADGITRYNSSLKGRELLSVLLLRNLPVATYWIVPPKSKVLFCFGEIDCRFHITKQAEKNGTTPAYEATSLAERYVSALVEYKSAGYDVIVWNAVPQTNPPVINPDYPHYGTYADRILVTETFNKSLAEQCALKNLRFLNVYNQLVRDNGEARMEYFMDNVHLGQQAMPLVIKALGEMFPGFH